jgi:HSP20 family protein
MYTKKVISRGAVPTFRNLDELFAKGLDQFFGNDFVSHVLPATNVSETENGYHLELVAAGFAKEDFNISTDKGLLTISAEVSEEKTDENIKYTRREFKKSSFKRSFQLPDTINVDGISANYENGILKISLPKDETVIVKRTITVA